MWCSRVSDVIFLDRTSSNLIEREREREIPGGSGGDVGSLLTTTDNNMVHKGGNRRTVHGPLSLTHSIMKKKKKKKRLGKYIWKKKKKS